MRLAVLCSLLVVGCASPLLAQGRNLPSFPNEAPKAGAVIELEVTLAEWSDKDGVLTGEANGSAALTKVNSLEKEGKLTASKRLRLTAFENVISTMQIGERKPRVTGMTRTAGGTQSSMVYENVGLLLAVRPAIIDDKITVNLNFEESAPKKRDDGPVLAEVEGEKIRAESTGTLTISTTLSLKSGDTVIVSSQVEGGRQTVLLLTAKVVK